MVKKTMKRKHDFEEIHTYEIVLIEDGNIISRHMDTKEVIDEMCTSLQRTKKARLWELVVSTISNPEFINVNFQYQMISCNET